MANIQPFVNLHPFKGTEKKLKEFIRQLESCMHVAGIGNADRHIHLDLHWKGGALSFLTNSRMQQRMTTRRRHSSSSRTLPQ